MYRCELPTYTSERYYLLSEIEEAGTIVCLNSTPLIPEAKLPILYLSWNMTQGPDALLSDADILYGKASLSNPVVVIECFGGEALLGDEDLHVLQKTCEKIQTSHARWRNSIFVFAVSNHEDASPGLEFVYDCCTQFRLTPLQNIALITLSDDILLANNAKREPDAVSGVNQMLVSSVEDPLQRIAMDFGFQVKPSPPLKSESKKASVMTMIVVLLLPIFAAYYFKWL